MCRLVVNGMFSVGPVWETITPREEREKKKEEEEEDEEEGREEKRKVDYFQHDWNMLAPSSSTKLSVLILHNVQISIFLSQQYQNIDKSIHLCIMRVT